MPKGKKSRRTAGRSSTGAKKAKTSARVGASAAKTDRRSIIPLGDRALIKPAVADEQTSPAGIILPDTVDREKTDRGTVVAVGEGKRNDMGEVVPLRVKKGDRVLFQWGDKVEIDDEEYYIVGENNILAILK